MCQAHLNWLVLTMLFSSSSIRAAEYYVAKEGRDEWSGRLPAPNAEATDGPFASLVRARDAARAGKSSRAAAEPVTVSVREGYYELEGSLALSAVDSGSAAAPTTYRAYGGEHVVLSAGRVITGFRRLADGGSASLLPATAREQVRVTDLRAQGFTDLGEVTRRGARLELFFESQPMTLARWPNTGFVRVAETTGGEPFTVHGITGDRVGRFVCEEDRLARWVDEPDPWLHGYWFWDWSDAYHQVKRIEPGSRQIEVAEPYHHYGYRPGQRFYALNLLSELDQPGEWFLDRESGRLFFWPPRPIRDGSVVLSRLPAVVTVSDADWVQLQGFTIEASRDTAVVIERGERCRVEGNVIRNTGGWAVRVTGGTRHAVVSNDIDQTAEGGISLRGGDRETLTACGHAAVNNHIRRFGRVYRTYRPAVGVGGVGVRVAHNLLHDGPHNAIQLGGNEHRIEFNEIHHVCYETGDVGAFYMGRDWTARGTLIRHNYFHDIAGPGLHGAMAVYLDDSASGIAIYGNLFVRAGRAAFIGGGRDNLVENNVFVDCKPAVHVDARGLGWMKNHVETGGTLPTRLAAMPYRKPPWSTKYPQLLGLLDDQPGAPKGNRVIRNVRSGGEWLGVEKAALPLVHFEDNLADGDPRFWDAADGDFRFQADSPAWKLGFRGLPLGAIGLYADAWR